MDETRMLSGEELVNKGVTKNEATLPEIGLKDVVPNGSWLEQKQIQAALEARKHLIEVERIEKLGTLSQAEWRDDIKLAEVTKQTGGYWQYLGHHIEKKLYLYPEEALFLIEVNCLQLKHDDIPVSLQKAYSLLLCDSITNTQYKVYASLSRLGYKVFRHNKDIVKDMHLDNSTREDTVQKVSLNDIEDTHSMNTEDNDSEIIKAVVDKMNGSEEPQKYLEQTEMIIDTTDELEVEENTISNSENVDEPTINIANVPDKQKHICIDNEESSSCVQNMDAMEGIVQDTENSTMETVESKTDNSYSKIKLNKLQNRQPVNTQSLHNLFKVIPDMYCKTTVTVSVPSEDHIPKNVFTNKLTYDINMANIRSRLVRPESAGTYSASDGVNSSNMRRIRDTLNESTEYIRPDFSYLRIPRHHPYRQFHNWRPYFNPNYINDIHCHNMFFPRPYMANAFAHSRFHFVPRSFAPIFRPHPNSPRIPFHPHQSRTRFEHTTPNHSDSVQQSHLETLKTLILKVKRLISSGNRQIQNVQSFERILNVYNKRYKTKLRLTDNYDLVDDDNVVETIEIEDDGETPNKKPRIESKTDHYTCNLIKLKNIAFKLKVLVQKGQAIAAHRRAFSNALKVFNKSYNADVFLNEDNEVIDRRHITLDSSSDSDCVIDEAPIVPMRKKLRNPFSIFKIRSEKLGLNQSEGKVADGENSAQNNKDCSLKQSFDINWLPAEDDFGRAEVVPKYFMNARLLDSYKHAYLIDYYFQDMSRTYDNWVDLKISFIKHSEKIMCQDESTSIINVDPNDDSDLSPLIKPEDCSNLLGTSFLEKIRIISTNQDLDKETRLSIDFDVYNRDVSNFRKTNPPKPHFRVICAEELYHLPTSSEVLTLQSAYTDDVPTVFAIVGSSISYLQLKISDIPIYVSSTEL